MTTKNETSSKHTPGPWRATQHHDDSWTVRTDLGANALAHVTVGKNDDADARLIAAAPEMLEALTKVARFMDERFGRGEAEYDARVGPVYRAVRYALARVEGE